MLFASVLYWIVDSTIMDESGYDATSLHSSSDEVIVVGVEPVEVPLDDGLTLLATVQAQLPGALGLFYYTANGKKRAVKLDAVTGKLHPPADGWTSHQYFVSQFHGACYHASSMNKYETATKHFSSTVQSVQKLLTSGLLADGDGDGGRFDGSVQQLLREINAQPTLTAPEIKNEKPLADGESGKSAVIRELTDQLRAKDNQLIKASKQHENELQKLRDYYETLLNGQKQYGYQDDVFEQRTVNHVEASTPLPNGHAPSGLISEELGHLRAKVAQLESEKTNETDRLNSATSALEHLERQRADAEWSLGEHKQWLAQSRDRCEYLEKELRGKEQQLIDFEQLRNRCHQLTEELQQKENDLELTQQAVRDTEQRIAEADRKWQEQIDSIHNNSTSSEPLRIELAAKIEETNGYQQQLNELGQDKQKLETELEQIRKGRNDLEWSLGEHKSWLAEANNRIVDVEERARKLESEKNGLATEADLWKARINELEQKVSAVDAEKDSLNVERDQLRNRVAELEKGEEERVQVRHQESIQQAAPQHDDHHVHALEEKIFCLEVQMKADKERYENEMSASEWSLGEHRDWLSKANERIEHLQRELFEKENSNLHLHEREKQLIEQLQKKEEEIVDIHNQLNANGDASDQLNIQEQTINRIQNEFDNERRGYEEQVRQLTEQRDQLDWSLNEHRQWLAETAANLERCQTQLADVAQQSQPNNDASSVELELLKQEKQSIADELAATNLQRNDLEWSLGEHKAWLEQAKKELQEMNESWRRQLVEVQKADEQQMMELRKRCEQAEANGGGRRNSDEYAERITMNHQMSSNGMHRSSSQFDVDDLSNELQLVHRKKYELEAVAADLQNRLTHAEECQARATEEARRIGEQLWLANERKAQLEHELASAHAEKGTMDGGRQELEDKIQWLENELRIAADRRNELQHSNNELREFRESMLSFQDVAFLIRKEPFQDRHKWNLSMWHQHESAQIRRCWFEWDGELGVLNDQELAANPTKAGRVYLVGSFYNWEVAVMCTLHEHGRFGVWIDLPVNYYEFRFLVDGKWSTAAHYPKKWNDFGTENNTMQVE